MIRLFTTTCLLLVVIVLVIQIGNRLSDVYGLESRYSPAHLVGCFGIGILATYLYRRRIDDYYDSKEDKKKKRT